MRLIITQEQAGDWTAYYIAKTILESSPSKEKPFTLGISVGFSMLPMYRRLIQFHKDGVLSFENVHFFTTGEYVGLPDGHPSLCREFISEHFFNHIAVEEQNIHFLNGHASDLKKESAQYEDLIKEMGGIRLWIAGLGDDGHLGFNEQGSSLQSRTRNKTLSFNTRVALSKFFDGDINQVPFQGLTIGIGTILDAHEIILLAEGKQKAKALALTVEGGVSHMYPASSLQMHPHCTVCADEEAVGNLRVQTYRYHKEVEKRSISPQVLIKGLYKSYYALTGARVFDGEKFLDNAVVIVENNRIRSVELDLPTDTVITKIDCSGRIIAPGFIDLQVNGCGGADINVEVSIDTLKTMHRMCLRHGVTSFAPTLITSTDERMMEVIDLFNHLERPELLGIICLHLEGPYFSKQKKGIHDETLIRKPTQEMLDRIIHCKAPSKIVTLAPEENSAADIEKLAKSGVIVSAGHTNGTYTEINEKIPAGITMATHLYNAMRTFDSREPGAVGAVLDSKNIYAGIIADGIHCNYGAIDIAYKTIGSHLFLVSDAVFPAGTTIEKFIFAGKEIFHKNGKCVDINGTLGGAGMMLDECLRNIVEHVNIPLAEALRMVSTVPAHAIRMDKEFGYIKDGYMANLTILNESDLSIAAVVENGNYIDVSTL
ncbi:MAG: N-acetylglucosamine-6-phosphate deacetylase [Brevinema sp.]